MRHSCLAFGLAAFIGTVAAGVLPAIAADDTWVSANGTDAGACTIDAPCRNLAYALAQTTARGTITILTSGRYAPVTVTKPVHIMADGVEAVIEGFGACGAAICINAGQNDVVSLRGLTLTVGDDLQKDAIAFTTGRSLQVDRCIVRGSTRFGILYHPGTSASLHVFDSQVTAGGHGVDISPTGGTHRVLFDGVQLHDSLHGLVFEGYGAGSVAATLRNSAIFNTGSSIIIDTGNGAVPVDLMVDRAVITNSTYGIDIRSGQDAVVRMGDSVLSGHQLLAISGSVASYGTNKVVEAIDAAWVPSTIPLK